MDKKAICLFSVEMSVLEGVKKEITFNYNNTEIMEKVAGYIERERELIMRYPAKNSPHSIGILCRVRKMLISEESMLVEVYGVKRVKILENIKSIPNHEPVLYEDYPRYLAETDIEKSEIFLQTLAFRKTVSIEQIKLDLSVVITAITNSGITDLETIDKLLTANSFYEIEKALDQYFKGIKKDYKEEIQKEIISKTNEKLDNERRLYYFKEQSKIIDQEIKEISKELNLKDEMTEVDLFLQKIKEKKGLPEEFKKVLEKEVLRLKNLQYGTPEGAVIKTYVNKVLSLPFKEPKKTKSRFNLKKIKSTLNKDHYALEEAKENILDYIGYLKHLNDVQSNETPTILCLVGPPGIGKTSFAQSISVALNRKFSRISLGGITDESDIRGHRRTYIGAMPGRIIEAMIRANTTDPVILLDEIDKVGATYRGDPAAALLEVLDPEQNHTFEDRYIDIPYDLSKVFFICTANDIQSIPRALRDRMEVIYLDSYTDIEKVQIAKKHIIPSIEKKIKAKINKFPDDILEYIIKAYTKEAGVRDLKRVLQTLVKKDIRLNDLKTKWTKESVKKLLGVEKYQISKNKKNIKKIGTVVGLAWTQVGGTSLEVQAVKLKGNGKVEFTGQLGDVMKESVKVAFSYLRSVADKYNIEEKFYSTYDVHIHFPEGATPKDGPSAGITITTVLYSIFTNKKVPQNIAMTGEITLQGEVLPVGGIKEKLIGAINVGAKQVILPYENKKDYEVLNPIIKDQLKVHFVKDYSEVIKIVFEK